jgi:hypothetical protein
LANGVGWIILKRKDDWRCGARSAEGRILARVRRRRLQRRKLDDEGVFVPTQHDRSRLMSQPGDRRGVDRLPAGVCEAAQIHDYLVYAQHMRRD